jgi:hypothetical protein
MTEPTKLRPQEIELQEVSSGNLARIGYDKESLTLVLEFKHGFDKGPKYYYLGVTEEEHQALVSAKSIGKHFASFIRLKYEGKKVEEVSEEDTAS